MSLIFVFSNLAFRCKCYNKVTVQCSAFNSLLGLEVSMIAYPRQRPLTPPPFNRVGVDAWLCPWLPLSFQLGAHMPRGLFLGVWTTAFTPTSSMTPHTQTAIDAPFICAAQQSCKFYKINLCTKVIQVSVQKWFQWVYQNGPRERRGTEMDHPGVLNWLRTKRQDVLGVFSLCVCYCRLCYINKNCALSLNHEQSRLETVQSVLTKSELPFVMHS